MSISPVVKGSDGGFDPSKMSSKIASKMMSDLDPNNTGKVTKDQFISGLTAKGISSADATKMFDAIDASKTGSIDKSDIETAIKNGKLKPPSDAPQSGPRKAGGPGGAGKPGGGGNTSTAYAAADTNQDGVVSVQEAAIYAMKHPSASTSDSTQTDSSKLGKNVDKLV
jgi:Ca2+-binding EF-hand superfamily protein